MKKKSLIALLAVLVMCFSLTACSGSSVSSESFKVDGAYYPEARLYNPADYGLSEEGYFDVNPQEREEYMTDNDEIWILVFASLGCLGEGGGDLTLPVSEYHDTLPGDVLPLTLTVNEDTILSTNYEFNDTDGELTALWNDYKSGPNLDTDFILYEGGSDTAKIVGAFLVKYHDYRVAKEEGQEWTLTWGDYSTTFNANDVVKKGSILSVSDAIK